MARPIKVMIASEDVRAELERRAKASTSAHRDRFRSRIILLRLDGLRIEDVAGRMNTSMPTVSMWSNRFERFGLDGLKDKIGRGRKPSIPAAKIERVITEATRPPEGCNRWSVRTMGRHAGISHSTVQRIWAKNDLKPHVTKTFKLSNDPKFEEKFWERDRALPDARSPAQELRRSRLTGTPSPFRGTPRARPPWSGEVESTTVVGARQGDEAEALWGI